MANPFNALLFQDSLPIPTIVDARLGGIFNFDIIPAKATLHSAFVPPAQNNCWTVVPAGSTASGAVVNSYLGPLIVAKKGVPIKVNWTNNTAIGAQTPPPINVINPVFTMDPTKWAAPKGLSMHLHGAKVLPQSDGWPLAESLPGNTQAFDYPNDQDANLIWYHDHAMDWTARNVHAGIAGGYLIRDQFDDELMAIIPAANEIPLVFQDRQLWDEAAGQLSSTQRYEIDPNGLLTRNASFLGVGGQIPVLPEFVGECNLVNGKLWPRHSLPVRDIYRLRIINGCNARTYALKLIAKVGGTWQFINNLLTVIGTDGGLMGAPIPLQTAEELIIAPGERRDVILDTRTLNVDVVAGISQLYLVNVAAFPFSSTTRSVPSTNPALTLGRTAASVLGGAPTMEQAPFHTQIQAFPQVMRFDIDVTTQAQLRVGFLSVQLPSILVKARAANVDFKYNGALGWRPMAGKTFGKNRVFLIDNQMLSMMVGAQNVGMMYLRECTRLTSTTNADLILRWDVDTAPVNPLGAYAGIRNIGYKCDNRMGAGNPMNDSFQHPLLHGSPTPGTYERWYFINLYPNAPASPLLPNPPLALPLDMHPIHIHLVNCYLSRRWNIAANSRSVTGVLNPGLYARTALRDTVRVNGSEIIELICYFPLGYNQAAQPWDSPISRYPFHCHILEHEEMGMMRYFDYN